MLLYWVLNTYKWLKNSDCMYAACIPSSNSQRTMPSCQTLMATNGNSGAFYSQPHHAGIDYKIHAHVG